MQLRWSVLLVSSLALFNIGCESDKRITQSQPTNDIEVAAKRTANQHPLLDFKPGKSNQGNRGIGNGNSNVDKNGNKGPTPPYSFIPSPGQEDDQESAPENTKVNGKNGKAQPPGQAKRQLNTYEGFFFKPKPAKPNKIPFTAALEGFDLEEGSRRNNGKGQFIGRKMILNADLVGDALGGAFVSTLNANINRRGRGTVFGQFSLVLATSQLAPLTDTALPAKVVGRFVAQVSGFAPDDISQLVFKKGNFNGVIKEGPGKNIKFQAKIVDNKLQGRLLVPGGRLPGSPHSSDDVPPGPITSTTTFSFNTN